MFFKSLIMLVGFAHLIISVTKTHHFQPSSNVSRWVGGKFKREGAYVYLWLIHIIICQILTQRCKLIILQLKFLLKVDSEANQEE